MCSAICSFGTSTCCISHIFREWISPATCSYIMHEMVENSSKYKILLNSFDVFIMPSMNPDGYEYTRTRDRMWRKTRSSNPGYRCKGTDPNRNWGYNWGLKGASTNPCDGEYCVKMNDKC